MLIVFTKNISKYMPIILTFKLKMTEKVVTKGAASFYVENRDTFFEELFGISLLPWYIESIV